MTEALERQRKSDSLQRQRRNVFVSCALIWVLYMGGVNIQELTLVGITFKAFQNPQVFLVGLWIAFAYFAYRYLVYFIESGANDLWHMWNREIGRAVNPRIGELVKAELGVTQSVHGRYSSLRHNKFLYECQVLVTVEDPTYGPQSQHKAIKHYISPWKLRPWVIKGLLRFIIMTPALTDHILPFVLVATTFIYVGLLGSWAGDLCTLYTLYFNIK